MSKKHLQRYVDEVAFRFNNRKEAMDAMFDMVTTKIAVRGKLPYKKLTA